MIRPPPRSPFFPTTPLFRSGQKGRSRNEKDRGGGGGKGRQKGRRPRRSRYRRQKAPRCARSGSASCGRPSAQKARTLLGIFTSDSAFQLVTGNFLQVPVCRYFMPRLFSSSRVDTNCFTSLIFYMNETPSHPLRRVFRFQFVYVFQSARFPPSLFSLRSGTSHA